MCFGGGGGLYFLEQQAKNLASNTSKGEQLVSITAPTGSQTVGQNYSGTGGILYDESGKSLGLVPNLGTNINEQYGEVADILPSDIEGYERAVFTVNPQQRAQQARILYDQAKQGLQDIPVFIDGFNEDTANRFFSIANTAAEFLNSEGGQDAQRPVLAPDLEELQAGERLGVRSPKSRVARPSFTILNRKPKKGTLTGQ